MPGALFQKDRNVWRVESAARASMLVDGAAYFGALRESLLQARHSVHIVGWDIDSRMRLLGPDCRADDGLPETLAEFLSALVERRPDLTIHLLLWDFSVLYALEREIFPTLSLNWNTPDQIRFCLDRAAPLGCSQHQKIVVIDDSVAFTGGLDLTIRRWDTSDHKAVNSLRCDPAGEAYRPFHDVQAVVDGPAAAALAELVRERWERAECELAPWISPAHDCWPQTVTPDFTDVEIGIARTLPACEGRKPDEGQGEVREVEQLFLDMIDAAERSIYVENQFLTAPHIAERLARRMQQKSGLEVLLVAPNTPETWIEKHTMRNGRIRFRQILEDAGVFDRVRMVYPHVTQDGVTADTMVHSKVMVIDDRILRIGSANLNNRSMGADTECDIVIAADSETQRATITRLRNRLIADHCGVTLGDVEDALARDGSLLAIPGTLQGRGHCLKAIEDGSPDPEEIAAYVEDIADPPRPLTAAAVVASGALIMTRITSSGLGKFAVVAVLLAALTAAWAFTPLSEYASPDVVRGAARSAADSVWGPFAVVAAFVIGGFVAFPVTVLIAATAAGFGPWLGFIYALTGAVASALATYAIGAMMGRDALRSMLGKRLTDIRKKISERGVLAIAAIRLVPIAPFTLVNLAAGASGITVSHYVAGTVIGLMPGLVVMSLMGSQIMRILSSPTPTEIAMLAGLILAWLAIAFGLQTALSKFRNESH